MGLLEDAKLIFEDLFGPDIANQLEKFDDPKEYPKDFLDECVHFMEDLIGKEAAEKKFQHLYKKYRIGR